ncbi:MAG: hypothetical protein RMJ33_10075 [Saprospiraceae bacterium]|nr:hypothetical protein [Saprospiraceae bacterium]
MNTPLRDDDALFATLLERWASGAFTRNDEAALHRLLADDAFRREAWEGFTALPAEEHAAALARLRQRLAPARRRVGFSIRRLAAAAAVLLLAGTLYWWWANAPRGAEQAKTPAEERFGDDFEAVSVPSAQEETLSGKATGRLPKTTERAARAGHAPAQPAPAEESKLVAIPAEAVKASDTSAALADQGDSLRSEAIQPFDLKPTSAVVEMSTEERAGRFIKQSDHFKEPAIAASPPSPQRNKSPAPPPKATLPPSSYPGGPPGRVRFPTGRVCPEIGWPTFWYQYEQSNLLRRSREADTLRLQVRTDTDGVLSLLKVEPALTRKEMRKMERFLRQYRWMPADTQAIILLPPVRY